jgi:hypothetical protein
MVDTSTFQLHLPSDKRTCLQDAIQQWAWKRACTQKELESVRSHLSHTATVTPQGRVFLHQSFPLLARSPALPHHYSRCNLGARADVIWWKAFLRKWNSSQSRRLQVEHLQMHQVHSVVELSTLSTTGSKSHGQTTGSQSISPPRSSFQ